MDPELIDAAENLLLFSREAWGEYNESLGRNVLPNTVKPVRSRIPPLRYRDEFDEAETSSGRSGCRNRKASMAVDQSVSDEFKHGTKNIKNLDQGQKDDMPEDMKYMIEARGGTSVVLVIQKPLTATDVNDVQNRLQIPFSQVASHGFLTDEENRFLGTRDQNGRPNHIDTMLLDPELRSHDITFRRWTMRKDSGAPTQVYAFNAPWIRIARLNGLRPGDEVQVWAFRVGEQLHFALAKVDVSFC